MIKMTTAEKRKKKIDKPAEISNPVGRPRIHDRSDIAQKLHEYIENAEIPVIAEFCYKNNIRRDYLYEMATNDEELSNAIKRCIEKKEAQLEIKSLKGEVNPTQAIFSLKQIGWTDKQHVESTNTNNNLNQDVGGLSPEERRARIDELNRRRGNGAAGAS